MFFFSEDVYVLGGGEVSAPVKYAVDHGTKEIYLEIVILLF